MASHSLNDPSEITALLIAAREGDEQAYDALLPRIYSDLRRRARAQLRKCRPGETLGTTAVVNEAYLKLVDRKRASFVDRNHFMAVASIAMRQILVDYARNRSRQKRGGGEVALSLDEARAVTPEGQTDVQQRAVEVMALDRALDGLTTLDPRLGKMVELRFFGGLSVTETAEVLAVSERTVKRDWRKARAYLYRAMHPRENLDLSTRCPP